MADHYYYKGATRDEEYTPSYLQVAGVLHDDSATVLNRVEQLWLQAMETMQSD